MKRTLSLILALVMALSLAACGKTDDNKGSASNAPADALTLLETVWASYSDDEKFDAMGGDYDNAVEGAPGAFDLSNTDNLSYMLTVPAEDASLIDDAASIMHLMNMNTFTCSALRVADKENAATLAEHMRGAIAGKQWMCGFPDKLVVVTLESYVVSMYGNEDMINTFRDKLTGAYSDAVIAYEEAIA